MLLMLATPAECCQCQQQGAPGHPAERYRPHASRFRLPEPGARDRLTPTLNVRFGTCNLAGWSSAPGRVATTDQSDSSPESRR